MPSKTKKSGGSKPTLNSSGLSEQQKSLLKSIHAQGSGGDFKISESFPMLRGKDLNFCFDIRHVGIERKQLDPRIMSTFKVARFTPLTLAAFYGNASLCRQLLRLGASSKIMGPVVESGSLFSCDQPLIPFFCALEGRHVGLAEELGQHIDFNRCSPGVLERYQSFLRDNPRLKSFFKEDETLFGPGMFGAAGGKPASVKQARLDPEDASRDCESALEIMKQVESQLEMR